ncbi:MAG: hypothetical protein M1838_003351 [Thelocarpon superellum]|nr:MAG: hypothetical protein M1838_003351 [Thelocarpon superellum]
MGLSTRTGLLILLALASLIVVTGASLPQPTNVAAATRDGRSLPQAVSTVDGGEEDDPLVLTSRVKAQLASVYWKAFDLIAAQRSAPTCDRLATVSLLDSCRSLERSSESASGSEASESVLDEIKSVYAARLAICELVGAGALPPGECAPLSPQASTKAGRGRRAKSFWRLYSQDEHHRASSPPFTHDEITTALLGRCLKSLETRPQWWTSYSNARQGAVVMCQAVRINQDRDLHEFMTWVASNTTDTLANATETFAAYFAGQHRFGQAIQAFNEDVMRGLNHTAVEVQEFFSQSVHSIRTLLDEVKIFGRAASTEAAKLRESMKESQQAAESLHPPLIQAREALQDQAELATQQTQQLEKSGEMADGVSNFLSLLHEHEFPAVVQAMEFLKKLLVGEDAATSLILAYRDQNMSNESAVNLHRRFDSLEEGANSLNASFRDMTEATDVMVATQVKQLVRLLASSIMILVLLDPFGSWAKMKGQETQDHILQSMLSSARLAQTVETTLEAMITRIEKTGGTSPGLITFVQTWGILYFLTTAAGMQPKVALSWAGACSAGLHHARLTDAADTFSGRAKLALVLAMNSSVAPDLFSTAPLRIAILIVGAIFLVLCAVWLWGLMTRPRHLGYDRPAHAQDREKSVTGAAIANESPAKIDV